MTPTTMSMSIKTSPNFRNIFSSSNCRQPAGDALLSYRRCLDFWIYAGRQFLICFQCLYGTLLRRDLASTQKRWGASIPRNRRSMA
jgi:hypothetical protein